MLVLGPELPAGVGDAGGVVDFGVGKLPRSSFIVTLVWQNLQGVSREKAI